MACPHGTPADRPCIRCRATAIADKAKKNPSVLKTIAAAVGTGMATFLEPPRGPYDAGLRPIVGAVFLRAFDWVKEGPGRRIVVECDTEREIVVWAEEPGQERVRFPFTIKGEKKDA